MNIVKKIIIFAPTMLKWFVFILFFVSLAADAYIYRGVVRVRFASWIWRVSFLAFAIVTDGAAVAAQMFTDAGQVIAGMWMIWIFVAAVAVKLLFLLGCLLDYLVKIRFWLFRWVGLAAALAVTIIMIAGATAGRTRMRIEQLEICSEKIPPAFDGYRIVQFSDLHLGTMIRPHKQVARLVEWINLLRADMVVNTGDVVNNTHEELTPRLIEMLGQIKAPDGVWSVWGNHDLGFYIKDESKIAPHMAQLRKKVDSLGWRTISGRSQWLVKGTDSLLVSGLDYPHDPMLNAHNAVLAGVDISSVYYGVEGNPFNIVLSHTPKLWSEIVARERGDLVLAGHVHAMQAKIGGWSPAAMVYPQWSGKYSASGSVLYVNDGMGCVGYPMRIGVRGEVTVITLKRCE